MSNSTEKRLPAKDHTVNIFSDILHRFLPYWPVFILALMLSISLAYIKLRYATPLYRAQATIMLKDEETGAESVINALEGTQTKKNVENEVEIIRSVKLMTEVVKELGLYAEVFMPGRVRDLYAYKSSPVTFKAIEPETIGGTGMVNFTFLPSEKAIEMGGVRYKLNDTANTPYGIFLISANQNSNIEDNRTFMVKFHSVKQKTKDLLGNLAILPGSKQSTVLHLTMTDPVPDRAVDILNKHIELYNKAAVDDKNTMAANTLEFIENRLALITVELSSIESDIETFKAKEGIVDISSEGEAFLSGVQTTDQSLSEVSIQLSVLDQVERYVVNKSDMPGTVPATLGIADPILMQLLNKLNEAELQLNRLKKTGAENAPSVLALQGQIAQLKPSILENIRNLRANLQATESKLRSESNKYNALLRSIPKKERKLLDIQRQQDVKNSIYTFLLEKREETALSYASAAPDSRLINEAEALPFPVSPKKTSIYLFAIAIALLAGSGFVLGKEKLNRFVMFRSEIEKATDAPIIGEIMYNKSKELLVIGESKRTLIAEQFRSLRTSLGFVGLQNTGNKTVLVTSSISGDGKSFISINLAVSQAMTGKKVLLIDLDLRKPKIATLLGLDTQNGISDYLAGLIGSDKLIRKYNEVPNLHVITAGAIPPNPAELLVNGRLEKLVQDFKQEFDYIILDSPPVGMVTDSKILQLYADLCLYVVRHNHTPKNFLSYIHQLYAGNELGTLFLVFNGIRKRGIMGISGSEGYGYGQGYGYGYGLESKSWKDSWKKKKKLPQNQITENKSKKRK